MPYVYHCYGWPANDMFYVFQLCDDLFKRISKADGDTMYSVEVSKHKKHQN